MHKRKDRRHSASGPDQRSEFARDRDRILYSSAFRRLAGITQIVKVGDEDIFHTRLHHSLKVAQIARRIAEYNRSKPAARFLKINPEVAEAAALAHDIGHPPFGHIGEQVLNELVSQTDTDGYEGNAQSFRILTKLSVRFLDVSGLDLTRATLAAILKYPWHRDKENSDRERKWGAYKTEEADFRFARAAFNHTYSQTAEAALMDYADDIAYSVHDLEDFHRCNAIPWSLIFADNDGAGVVDRAYRSWHRAPSDAKERLRIALQTVKETFEWTFKTELQRPYDGSTEARRKLRSLTSRLIGTYIKAAEPLPEKKICADKPVIKIEQRRYDEIRVLKAITRDYIIDNPSLMAQQLGQKKIIADLFEIISSEAKVSRPKFLPFRLSDLYSIDGNNPNPARFAADCISSLTEQETIKLHARLTGLSSGSVLDPIVR
ncbi:deoxyguanosinetriphosphate triphosphohydrolase family protein [Parvularcula marina]|uniref:deoxyguanosinetriphosphate triphosphohydrolase family protein n=1 Tax=Parvularcula marina TaxID=2292771 RepID=UPI0022781B6A|nr:dNTP triphosphohydrolase [Parvularcula marina]